MEWHNEIPMWWFEFYSQLFLYFHFVDVWKKRLRKESSIFLQSALLSGFFDIHSLHTSVGVEN